MVLSIHPVLTDVHGHICSSDKVCRVMHLYCHKVVMDIVNHRCTLLYGLLCQWLVCRTRLLFVLVVAGLLLNVFISLRWSHHTCFIISWVTYLRVHPWMIEIAFFRAYSVSAVCLLGISVAICLHNVVCSMWVSGWFCIFLSSFIFFC